MTAASQPSELSSLIAAEIRALRKGRGLRTHDLDRRLGPHLRELAACTPTGDISELRRALMTEISTQAASLQYDLRTAVMASVGVLEETRDMARFGDRVSWLAQQADRNYRTALRRIDAAEQLLAEEVARELQRRRGRPASAPNGWYLEELSTVVRLDTPTPEIHERRRIVSAISDLAEVMAWMDFPRAPGEPRLGLQVEVLYGGQLVRRETPTRSRFQFMIQLPQPLQEGDVHEYELIFRVPPGEHMKPHYLFTPECRCDSFDLRARFDPRRLPAWIRQVAGETVRMFDDSSGSPGESLPLDPAGEVHLRFRNPAMYLCYGLQWQFAGNGNPNGAHPGSAGQG